MGFDWEVEEGRAPRLAVNGPGRRGVSGIALEDARVGTGKREANAMAFPKKDGSGIEHEADGGRLAGSERRGIAAVVTVGWTKRNVG